VAAMGLVHCIVATVTVSERAADTAVGFASCLPSRCAEYLRVKNQRIEKSATRFDGGWYRRNSLCELWIHVFVGNDKRKMCSHETLDKTHQHLFILYSLIIFVNQHPDIMWNWSEQIHRQLLVLRHVCVHVHRTLWGSFYAWCYWPCALTVQWLLMWPIYHARPCFILQWSCYWRYTTKWITVFIVSLF